MLEIAIFVTVCIYLQVISHRDKKRFKEMQQIRKAIEREEKRRAREKELKDVRINHPKVTYLADYRRA